VSDLISLPPGSPLGALVDRSPTLVVFLRHFGCTFCREALADVSALRPQIDATGTRIAFVHLESDDVAKPWFDRYGLSDALQVSDPSRAHYRAFDLGNAGASALVDPVVWARGAASALSHGFGLQPPGLLRQLPGVFVVHRDRLLAAFRHRRAADRPDYLDLIRTGRARDVTLRSPEQPVQ
jgi:AhpC/TSA antioxidant enzyme